MKTKRTINDLRHDLRRELEEAEHEVQSLEDDLRKAESRLDDILEKLEEAKIEGDGSVRCRCGEMFFLEQEKIDSPAFFNLRGEKIKGCPGCGLPCAEVYEEINEILGAE